MTPRASPLPVMIDTAMSLYSHRSGLEKKAAVRVVHWDGIGFGPAREPNSLVIYVVDRGVFGESGKTRGRFLEVFGVVRANGLAICRRQEQEAIRIANDTEYGLTSAVFTNNLFKGLRVADQIESGQASSIDGISFDN
jgi:hypothetical protein